MQRAQQRDAAATKSFFFRKDIYTTNPSAASTVCSSTRSNSPVDDGRRKEKKLTNHFTPPPLPLPDNGLNSGPVEEEYEEMTMMEIMTGKVIVITLLHDVAEQKYRMSTSLALFHLWRHTWILWI